MLELKLEGYIKRLMVGNCFNILSFFKIYPVVVLMILSTNSFGQQMDSSLWKRASKDELVEIRKNKNKYIPINIQNFGVLIERNNAQDLLSIFDKAIKDSYSRNSFKLELLDSSYLAKDSILRLSILQGYKKSKKSSEKKHAKKFKKVFRNVVFVNSDEIPVHDSTFYRYVIKNVMYTDKYPGNVGWMVSPHMYIYDRIEKKNYDVFMPINYSLLDLMKD